MVKHTQTMRWQFVDELFGVFDHFVKLALKGLNSWYYITNQKIIEKSQNIKIVK